MAMPLAQSHLCQWEATSQKHTPRFGTQNFKKMFVELCSGLALVLALRSMPPIPPLRKGNIYSLLLCLKGVTLILSSRILQQRVFLKFHKKLNFDF